jgi:hypothetical protein
MSLPASIRARNRELLDAQQRFQESGFPDKNEQLYKLNASVDQMSMQKNNSQEDLTRSSLAWSQS